MRRCGNATTQSVLAFTDKLAPDVPGRAALRRDARVAIAQHDYAFERYAEAADGLEKAAKEGELPRYARAMQAWCDLRLGNRERSAARFAALYRESPDRESAEGLIAASGGAGAIPADLAAKEPLRTLVAARQGEDAFRNGRFLEARALDPKRWGEAGSPGVLQALLGGGFRKKTGEPGLGKMRQSLWPAFEVASGLSPWTAIAIRGDRAELDAGTLSSTALVGSAPTGAGPTPQLQTKATVNEGRVAVRYERGFALMAALGRGPDGGPIGARTVGAAELALTPAWGQSALAVFAEPVRETVLSYAGMRDPWTGTPWGGVMRRGVEARFLRLGDAPWTMGLRVRGEDITGTLVQDNTRAVVDATLGRDLGFAGFAYAAASAYAGLEGYRRNLGQMTIGHGGYFSPQRYARAGAALDFMTEEDRRWLVRGRLSGGYFDKRDDEIARPAPGPRREDLSRRKNTGPRGRHPAGGRRPGHAVPPGGRHGRAQPLAVLRGEHRAARAARALRAAPQRRGRRPAGGEGGIAWRRSFPGLPPRRRRAPSTSPSRRRSCSGAGILLYMVNLREAHFSNVLQLGAGWICIAVLFAMNLFRKSRKAPWRYVFVLVSAFLALRYIWWRSFETLIYTHPIDFIGMTALYLAELYSLTLQLMSLFVNLSPLARGARAAARGPLAVAHGGRLHPHLQRGRGDRAPDGARRHPDRLSQGPLRVHILDDGATLAKRNDPARGEEAWQPALPAQGGGERPGRELPHARDQPAREGRQPEPRRSPIRTAS